MENIKMENIKMEILRTNKYEIFKELKGNREISPLRITKIINSIKNVGYIINPIIVNEKMEIIDGQGRLEALRILKMPVDYIIQDGIGIKECISMNIYQTNWSLNDYIKSYAEKGNENYIKFRTLLNKYPEYNCFVIATALKGVSKIGAEQFKKGNFTVSDDEYNRAIKKLEYLENFKELFDNVKGKKYYLYQSLLFCYDFEDVDNNRMLEKMKELSSTIGIFRNISTCMDEIEKIYNKNIPKNNYAFISNDYKRSLIGRGKRGIEKMNNN